MQKEQIIQTLKSKGFRITRQRQILLDIILEEDCSCCKEIYYKAASQNKNIGAATVYRMVNMLEDIGAISRKNMYKIAGSDACTVSNACIVELDDGTSIELSAKDWNRVIRAGLIASGYIEQQSIRSIQALPCDCANQTC